MRALNDVYDKTKLSDEKKAELKAALKKSFPQYAENDTGRTEVIKMENINTAVNGNKIRVHSRKVAPAIVAAALVLVAGGALIHRVVQVRAYMGGDPNAPASQTQDGGNNNDAAGFIDDMDSEQAHAAKEMFCAAASVLADITASNDIAVFDDSLKVTREMLLNTRDVSEEHKHGIVTETEFVRKIDEMLRLGGVGDTLDAADYDFEITFASDENGDLLPKYVFVYPDNSHSTFYSYPMYSDDSGNDADDGNYYVMQNSIEDAKALYALACEVYENCVASGRSVSAEEVSLKNFSYDENYQPFGGEDFVTPEIFAHELHDFDGGGSVGLQVNEGGGVNYRIVFETEDGVTAIGVKSATIATTWNGKMQSFTYPEEAAIKDTSADLTDIVESSSSIEVNDGEIRVPDVIGMKLEDAEKAIGDLGIKYVTVEMNYDEGEYGVCLGVHPDVGSIVDPEGYITIYHRREEKGYPADTFLQEVIGMQEAAAVLKAKKMHYNVSTTKAAGELGVVVDAEYSINDVGVKSVSLYIGDGSDG